SEAETAFEHDVYDGSIAYLDREVGRLVSELERMGELTNTILVITSDHGEEFGEHAFMKHGDTLYTQALWVPLVILYPKRVPAGRVVASSVGLSDVAATVLDLAEVPNIAPLPGTSLARCWEKPEDRMVVSYLNEAGRNSAVSCLLGSLHYIRDAVGGEE